MQDSIFDNLPLLEVVPRYATLGQFLRLSAPPGPRLRQIIDSWVAAESVAIRAKLRTDLVRPRTSLGTFSELVLWEVLKRKFGLVEREPKGLPVGGKNPDFGVRIGSARRLVVFESTTIPEKVDQRTHRRRQIMRGLDGISGPWHLMPEWGWSTDLDTIRPSVVVAAVKRAIKGLPAAKHKLEIPIGDALFRATLLPASRHRESIVSADSSGGAMYSPGVESVKDDIKAKTARYKGLKHARIPLVLAIGSDWPLIDWETMFSALYGDEQITLTFNGEDLVAVDEGSLNFGGRLTPSRTGEIRYRGLSAA